MDLNIALALIGALTLMLSLIAELTRSEVYPLSEPMIATLIGVLIGPLVWDVLRLSDWGDPQTILEQVARLTIAFSVMGIALRLPRHYLRHHLRAMLSVLTLGMLMMWVVSGLLTWWLLSVPFWTAMLIGALASPTDPVLSGTIVTGTAASQNIPARLRHSLSFESGANDGGGYLFVFFAILMVKHSPGEALTEWLTHTLPWAVLTAVLVGALIGYGAGRLQHWAADQDFTEKTSLMTVTLALTATVLGVVKLMGSDGILAVFAAGLAFNWAARQQREEEETRMQETLKRALTFPIFVFFGMALPWRDWQALGGAGVLLVALILLLRRLPMMFALRPLMRPLRTTADTLFNGWFGPIGVAALYYAALSERETGLHEVWVVGSLVVAGSIIVHGMTATPFTKWYGRQAGQAKEDREEQEAVRRS